MKLMAAPESPAPVEPHYVPLKFVQTVQNPQGVDLMSALMLWDVWSKWLPPPAGPTWRKP